MSAIEEMSPFLWQTDRYQNPVASIAGVKSFPLAILDPRAQIDISSSSSGDCGLGVFVTLTFHRRDRPAAIRR
jgi:hypothetical protein